MIDPTRNDDHEYVQDVYIDESYDSEVFVLSLCSGHPQSWRWFRLLWTAYLEELNFQRVRSSLGTISRYHATDCANRRREFSNWTVTEQIEITQRLIKILLCCPMHCVSICVVYEDIRAAWTETLGIKPDEQSCKRAAYFVAAQVAADYLVSLVHDINPRTKFRLAYDQGPDERMLILAIEHLQTVMQSRFSAVVKITREDSKRCIPLQAADFLAYESFKERRREISRPDSSRRKSFAALLAGGIGISLRTVKKEWMVEILIENMKADRTS